MATYAQFLAEVWTPHSGQREFLDHPSRIKVLACGRRWGKTDACAAAIVAQLLGETPTRTLILAPTLDQARMLFDRVVALLDAVLAKRRARDAPTRPPAARA
ncbi:MAG TPA: hypothetical protein PLH94_13890, partial [Fimbriimonadaceae bacterium]|nr:hypothetical protein [Fimbriimonadaceae bacterium]